MSIVTYFPKNDFSDIPDSFNNPFRYAPCSAVRCAAKLLMERISSNAELASLFAEGKMLGVLVVKDLSGKIGFLSGFSGNVGGKNHIDGFVPPIHDLLNPNGYFKIHEAEISKINREIDSICNCEDYRSVIIDLEHITTDAQNRIASFKAQLAESKRRRECLRMEQCLSAEQLDELIKESQYEKASFRRVKKNIEAGINALKEKKEAFDNKIRFLKNKRKSMSDALQSWIFEQYIVHNALGDSATIKSVFAAENLTPPGGTGECAAPKLLEYAYRNDLQPLAMGEFWYGSSPETAVRTHGHFYPSCTSKCGPLLSYMLNGLNISKDSDNKEFIPNIIYQDTDIIVADKPSGMPSVPGLDQRMSLLEWLENKIGNKIYIVHRLDMDTSGIIIYALNQDAATLLQRQFEAQTVRKEYLARLCQNDNSPANGIINLPLSPDYDERPRQKVDRNNGKPAVTEFSIIANNQDGTTDISFRPITGRTHQLRVHAAHSLGLGRPILGDLLYGGHSVLSSESETKASRLFLHAYSITFVHPISQKVLTFKANLNETPNPYLSGFSEK